MQCFITAHPKKMTQFIVRVSQNGRGVVDYYSDDYFHVVDGSIDLKALIDEGFFGDNFRYLTKDDEDFLPSDFCYIDEFKTIEDDEFIIEDGRIYKENEPVTFFSYDLKTYDVVEIDSAEDLVKEFNANYVGEKLGEQVAKWLGYYGDVLYGYHNGSEYMDWYLYGSDDGEDE